MKNYTVVDDFLPIDVFENIRIIIFPSHEEIREEQKMMLEGTPIDRPHPAWAYNPAINTDRDKHWSLFYMFHIPYHHPHPYHIFPQHNYHIPYPYHPSHKHHHNLNII